MKFTKTNSGEKNNNKKFNIPTKHKTGYDLMKHFGVLKGDTEYEKLKKEVKAGWIR